MSKLNEIDRDFVKASNRFPKLKLRYLHEQKLWCISGELDICDIKGTYWDSFNIAIILPKEYPYGVPVVCELSEKIPREIDWHVSEDGVCCLDIPHALEKWAKRGIRIDEFIALKVYSFFANYLYRKKEDKYSNGEYAHYFDGVIQFYKEELSLSIEAAIVFLNMVLNKTKTGRNAQCPCGSGKKIKKCHIEAVGLFGSLGEERLKKDLEGFKNYKEEQNISTQIIQNPCD